MMSERTGGRQFVKGCRLSVLGQWTSITKTKFTDYHMLLYINFVVCLMVVIVNLIVLKC